MKTAILISILIASLLAILVTVRRGKKEDGLVYREEKLKPGQTWLFESNHFTVMTNKSYMFDERD